MLFSIPISNRSPFHSCKGVKRLRFSKGLHTDSRPSSKRAFTLIELLTVIGLIIILGGILFPFINYAVDQSRQSKGSHNLRQIYTLFILYAQEHDNEILPGFQGEGNNPDLGPFMTRRPGEGDNFAITLNDLYMDRVRRIETIFVCPADERFTDGDYNTWMAVHGSYRMATWPSWNWTQRERNRWTSERFVNLGHCIFLFDSNGGGHGSGVHFVDFRHRGRANVLFMDGSVRLLNRDDFPANQTEGIWQGIIE